MAKKSRHSEISPNKENSSPPAITESAIEVKDFYTPADVGQKDRDYGTRLGDPGEYPYARGIQAHQDRNNPFHLRQYVGFGTVEESNRLFRYLVSQGQSVLSVAYDLPTQLGYDSDHPRVDGVVGTIGIPCCSLEDWEGVFEGIDLQKTKVNSVCNAQSVVALAWHLVAAQKRGIDPQVLMGVVQNDILKEFMARGNYIFPPDSSMRLTTDVVEYATRHLPAYTPIYLCGYHIREAGSDAVQEVAFSLASGIAYLEACLSRGLTVDQVAPRIQCLLTGRHRDFLEEVAKFRALRRLWARTMRERFGSKDPAAQKLYIMQYEGGVGFTTEQKEVNLARGAIAAVAGALGGVHAMGLCTMDEALGIPSEKSLTLALRTCQVVAHETGIPNVQDPLAGSYYVEWLTDQIEKRALAYVEEIDSLGGMLEAVKKGHPQRKIADTAFRHQKEEEDGIRVVVGRNRYTDDEPVEERSLYQQDPKVLRAQIKRLKKLRQSRSSAEAGKALDNIRRLAQSPRQGGKHNLVPAVVEAVKAYATVGEICGILREEFGEHREEVYY